MENAENSPDEFFGSHRMTLIANGVTDMLIGQEPPAPTSPSTSLWAVYLVILGILALQLGGIASSVHTIPRWRTDPSRRPTGALRIGLHVALPLLVSWSWAFIVLVGLPRIVSAPVPALLAGLPDLGYPLVASAILAFGWGLIRAIWATRTLRTPPRFNVHPTLRHWVSGLGLHGASLIAIAASDVYSVAANPICGCRFHRQALRSHGSPRGPFGAGNRNGPDS
jgi:hypothetical protein